MSAGKILFCDSAREWGGIEHWVVALAHALRDRGWETRIAAREGSELCNPSRNGGVETIAWPFQRDFDWRTIMAAHRLFRTWEPDLLVVAIGRDIRTVGLVAHVHKIPILWRLGMPYPNLGWFHRWTGKFVVDRVIVPSQHLKQTLQPYGWLNGRVVVVNNGIPSIPVPTSEQIRQARLSLGWQDEDFVVLFVGRLKPVKGVDLLIAAFAEAASDHPRLRLVIVGDGPSEVGLRQQAASLGVDNRIQFAGYQRDTTAFYEGCDLFVVPSRDEPFGWVLLEAMSRRKPMIACAVGGIPEVVGNEGAWLVLKENAEELREAIVALHSDGTRRDALAEAGLGRVRTVFYEQRMIDNTEAVFRDLISSRATGLQTRGPAPNR